jgi:hypothetical protein
MFGTPRVPDRSDIKPIYLIVVEDPTVQDGIVYYKSKDINETNNTLDFRGFVLVKTQAEKLVKNPRATESAKTEPKAVNRKIPWHRVIRIDNTTYKIPQGENND